MRKFKIKDVEKYIVSIYEIEAINSDTAFERYINELAGSLAPVKSYYDPNEEDEIIVLDCE